MHSCKTVTKCAARLPLVCQPGAAGLLPFPSQLLRIRGPGPGTAWRMARQLVCRTAAMPLRTLASGRLRPGALRMDTQRLILLFIFGFSLLMLWEAWDKEHRPKPLPAAPTAPPAVAAPGQPGPLPAT